MKPISYQAVGEFRKHRKLKSGLAPTGVLRQNLVLHNSFQGQIYAAPSQKTNADQPFFPFIPWQSRLGSEARCKPRIFPDWAAPPIISRITRQHFACSNRGKP